MRDRRVCLGWLYGRSVSVLLALALGYSGWCCESARAAPPKQPGAGWALSARSYPTNIRPGARGVIDLDVLNVGAAASAGVITVTDELPPGVRAVDAGEQRKIKVGENAPEYPELTVTHEFWNCTGNGPGAAPAIENATKITCTNTELLPSFIGGGGHPNADVEPFHNPPVAISVTAPTDPVEVAQASSVPNRATVAGGGAPVPASVEHRLSIGPSSAGFGFDGWDVWASNADGSLDTQAGSHPYELTFEFNLTTKLEDELLLNTGEARNIAVDLPPGLIGNPMAVPECSRQVLLNESCPDDTQVGTLSAYFAEAASLQQFPIFNMVPPPGEPAQLAFNLEGITTFLDTEVRSGTDYGITTHSNANAQREITGAVVTLWGVPGDPTHDPWRTQSPGGCTTEETQKGRGCRSVGIHGSVKPFLTMPTSCDGPEEFRISANSYQEQDTFVSDAVLGHDSSGSTNELTGCERLAFGPLISLAPTTTLTDSPAGLTADVTAPVGGLMDSEGLGTSDVEGATVTLPDGLVVNPGQAAGLQACQETQAGVGSGDNGPARCPEGSKLGEAEVESPLLPRPLRGNIYLLQSNPPNIKILATASGEGVNVKLVGEVHLDEATGRLTAIFQRTPQLPFTDFQLRFDGGAKAAVDTPTSCGMYSSSVVFTAWASPFISDFNTASRFAISSGADAGVCPSGPLAFSPIMAAGSTDTEAGAFTGFTQLLTRGDGQQRLQSFSFKAPQGLSGMISKVPLCPEAQANAGACSAASHIGHAIVQSGAGSNPLTLPQPGGPEISVYLTGPYKGAPFGLSIVTPVIAGPFNLGTILTRAKIDVDPRTAQVTVTTDPLPQIIDGVPTDLRSINAVIDRPGFFFNPTNCTAQQFSGTATSAGGADTAPLSSRFAVGGCRGLTFAPKFSASTQGNGAFNRNGASLKVKITTHQGPQNDPSAPTEANIKKVDVALPVQLPSRLTTLQKACTEKQFATNPAGCPTESNVGTATAHTPVLPVPLTGPAYLVSHGGAAFPDLDIILQGDGVTIVLTGNTDIKKGVTFSRFDTTPDAPFSSFELNLPERKFSALAANGNLCKPTKTVTVKKRVAVRRHGRVVHVLRAVKQQAATTLAMPTTITGQNGAVVTQTTKVAVTGCPKAMKLVKKHKKAKPGKQHKRSK
jgi:hypothetical protein